MRGAVEAHDGNGGGGAVPGTPRLFRCPLPCPSGGWLAGKGSGAEQSCVFQQLEQFMTPPEVTNPLEEGS